MFGERLDKGQWQSVFYRNSYHKMLRLLLVLSVIILLLVMGILYLVIIQPKAQYYASTTTGRVIPLSLMDVQS